MLPPSPNGGPPAPAQGLAAASRPPRPAGRPRRRSQRAEKIGRAIERAQTQQRSKVAAAQGVPGGPPRPRPAVAGADIQARRPAPARPAPGVSDAMQPDLGSQLSRRVSAGAIDQGQAEKVAQDRALLEAAYGPDWREKVFGGQGRVQRTRASLAENPDDPQAKELYEQLMRQRSSALDRAKRKQGTTR